MSLIKKHVMVMGIALCISPLFTEAQHRYYTNEDGFIVQVETVGAAKSERKKISRKNRKNTRKSREAQQLTINSDGYYHNGKNTLPD